MVGGRRALVAVLATAAVVLPAAQASLGIETPSRNGSAAPLAASAFPASRGTTVRTAGASDPEISGNGRWQIYASAGNIFVRDLVHGGAQQVSWGNAGLGNGSADDPSVDPVTTPDGTAPESRSFLPSISADGRYVSFLTYAFNIVPVPGAIEGRDLTLVVCDRDPSGARDANYDWILDQPAPGKTYPDYRCRSVYSSYSGFVGDLAPDQRPRLSADGSRIVFSRNVDRGVTGVYWSPVSDYNGLVAPVVSQVPIRFPDQDAIRADQRDPVITEYGNQVVFVAGLSDGPAVVETTLSSGTSVRVDAAPADEGGGYLGDLGISTGTKIDSLSMAEDASGIYVAYHVFRAPPINFKAAPLAGSPRYGDYVYLTRVTSSVTTQLVSRDNAGDPVEAYADAISGDGRYLAFTTTAPGAHDGTDAAGEQIVERDLNLDSARASANPPLPRLPGALVTTTAGCDTAPTTNCASINTAPSMSDLSIDGSGVRISFASTAADLVPGDSGTSPDSFVRTWQPATVNGTTDFGNVPLGGPRYLSVPVELTGFGPLVVRGVDFVSATLDYDIVGEDCSGRTLYYGAGCSVSVRAVPSSASPKKKSAALAVTSDQLGASGEAAGRLTTTVTKAPPAAAPEDTVRTSLTSAGKQSDSGGSASMISGNGRWQVFTSYDDLTGRRVDSSSSFSNVFVRDLADPQHVVQISLHDKLGANPTAPSVPLAVKGHPQGTEPAGDSFAPTISSDGRLISFITYASDVVPQREFGDGHTEGFPQFVIVVCDRDPDHDGIFDEPQAGKSVPDYACYPVESGANYGDATLYAYRYSTPRLSGDGSRIAWVEGSYFGNYRIRVASLHGADGVVHAPNNYIYVPSSVAGVVHGPDRNDEGQADQFDPMLTENGRAVAFYSRYGATNAIIVSTLPDDLTTSKSIRFDVSPAGGSWLGDDDSASFSAPAVSDDGSTVAFAFGNGADRYHRVYVATSRNGTVTSVVRSLDNEGHESGGLEPALSGDGRYLAYVATQPNAHNGIDAKGYCADPQFETEQPVACQIVARDLVVDARLQKNHKPLPASQLVSRSITGKCVPALPPGRVCAGNDNSDNPSIDNTGSEISYDSYAGDLVPGDTNTAKSGSAFAATTPAAALASPSPAGPAARAAAPVHPLAAPSPSGGPPPSDTMSAMDTFVSTWRPTVIAPTLDFGTVKIGSSKAKAITATLQNFGPISLATPVLVGPDAGDFKVVSSTCGGSTLHETGPTGAAEKCTITVRFSPTLPGPRTAVVELKIAKNSYPRHNPNNTVSYDPALVRNLTGAGAIPVAAVSPTTLGFGNRLAEDPVTKTVTITNTGGAPLIVSGATVTDTTVPGAGGDYNVNASGCTNSATPVGGSCSIKVTFRGHRVGPRDAVLVIDDNTAAGSVQVGLRAKVKTPTVESNPAVSPVRRVITVSGTGFAPNHDVEVGFDNNAQLTVTTKADGTFSTQMVVLPNGPQGPRTLFGHSVGYSPTIAADFPFLVVLSSTDPGLVVIRD